MFVLTSKQKKYLLAKDKRLNFLSGSVRSGKTYISLLKFGLWVASMPKDAEFAMIGKTGASLNRNCFGYMYQFFGEQNFKVSFSGRGCSLFGRKFWIVGANDVRSENQIRGMTLAGAYCDEVTLYPENFFVMLLTRLSYKGAKLFATCNPDTPNHYIKVNYIDKADQLDCAVWNFLLTDNTFLSQEYIDNITKEFVGVFYNRFVLGQWVKADGLVYPMYDNTVTTINREYSRYIVSMDYGILNPTAIILWGLYQGTWYAVKEFYHSGRDTKEQKTDQQYYDCMQNMLGDIVPDYIYIDPSAASFITLVRQIGKYKVRHCNNEVLAGIQNTALALSEKLILFNDCCKMTISEFGLYSWDEKSGNDTVIKENDHAMDAVRYFVYSERLAKRDSVIKYESPFLK